MNKETFSAVLEQLYPMLKFIENESLMRGISPFLRNKIILAAEEALVNIIEYSYPSQSGLIEIVCEECENPQGLRIIIKDNGAPFDPLKQLSKMDALSTQNSESLGGHGVHLYCKVMDKVEYQRTKEGNQLILIKYL